MGSQSARTAESGGLRITYARFPAGATLAPHVHDRATFAVMLGGAFDLLFARHSLECPPATVFTEPAGERHANRMGAAGAEVVVIQPDPSRGELWRPCASLLERIHHFRDAELAGLAARLAREMRWPDELSPLTAEGLALELLGRGARLERRNGSEEPAWLRRAYELVRGRFRERLRLEEIAAEVGVHPATLSRRFRTRYGAPVGETIRRLRVRWAARRLEESDEPVGAIALAAGFSDQSHLTRVFRRHTGHTPAAYRRARRRRAC